MKDLRYQLAQLVINSYRILLNITQFENNGATTVKENVTCTLTPGHRPVFMMDVVPVLCVFGVLMNLCCIILLVRLKTMSAEKFKPHHSLLLICLLLDCVELIATFPQAYITVQNSQGFWFTNIYDPFVEHALYLWTEIVKYSQVYVVVILCLHRCIALKNIRNNCPNTKNHWIYFSVISTILVVFTFFYIREYYFITKIVTPHCDIFIYTYNDCFEICLIILFVIVPTFLLLFFNIQTIYYLKNLPQNTRKSFSVQRLTILVLIITFTIFAFKVYELTNLVVNQILETHRLSFEYYDTTKAIHYFLSICSKYVITVTLGICDFEVRQQIRKVFRCKKLSSSSSRTSYAMNEIS